MHLASMWNGMETEGRLALKIKLGLDAKPTDGFKQLSAMDRSRLFNAFYNLGACPGCASTFGHNEGCQERMRRLAVDAIGTGKHSGETITSLIQMVQRKQL
jgi:hypothetical protein